MAPLLNDLLCFFTFVGDFKEITPPRAVSLKREIDKRFYVDEALFSTDFASAYHSFIDTCFETYTGFGEDAKIRSSAEEQRRERHGAEWDPSWEKYFATTRVPEPEAVRRAYRALMARFAIELGVGLGKRSTSAGTAQ